MKLSHHFLFILLLAVSQITYAQCTIKGELVDRYGKDGWGEYELNGEREKWPVISGQFEISGAIKGTNEIILNCYGYTRIKLICDCIDQSVNIGKIYLVSDVYWLDGPKNGYIVNHYSNGQIKDSILVRRNRISNSKFYNETGEVTQELISKKRRKRSVIVNHEGEPMELIIKFEEGMIVYDNQIKFYNSAQQRL